MNIIKIKIKKCPKYSLNQTRYFFSFGLFYAKYLLNIFIYKTKKTGHICYKSKFFKLCNIVVHCLSSL